jgi:threonine dehydrogenase-like Zn-dependent dehydrogenase
VLSLSRYEADDAVPAPEGLRHHLRHEGWTPRAAGAQALYARPGVKLIHLPKGLDPEAFIGGGCGLVTSLHAVDLAGIRLGHSVAVLGAGPVGQSAIALSALSGASEVIAVGDPASRLEFARRMGATTTFGLDMPGSGSYRRRSTRDRAAMASTW